MAHVNAEIEVTPAFGWLVDVTFGVDVTTVRSGMEHRNCYTPRPRRRFQLPFQNILNEAYLSSLNVLFEAVLGSTHTFNAKDFANNQATLASLGNAPSGSTPVQLYLPSTAGALTTQRKITRPVEEGFVLYQNGVAKAGTIDTTTGLFTPDTAWTAGQPLTWSGPFLVPVRFMNASLPMSIDNKSNGKYVMNGSVELLEVFE